MIRCQGSAPSRYYISAGNQIHQLMPLAFLHIGLKHVSEAGQGNQHPSIFWVPSLTVFMSPQIAHANLLYTGVLSNLILMQKNIFVLPASGYEKVCPDMVEFWPWEQLTWTRRPTVVVFLVITDIPEDHEGCQMSWLKNNATKTPSILTALQRTKVTHSLCFRYDCLLPWSMCFRAPLTCRPANVPG